MCAREREDGLWEGWLEFAPVGGGEALETERETTQPNRDDTVYWARGLTWAYVDGALNRLLKPLPQLATRRVVTARPSFEQPARPRARAAAGNSDALGGHAVLNPFEVYRESDTVLRGQLNALDAGQLRNIIREYGIASMDAAQLGTLPRDELIAMIIVAAERRAA